jgi:cytochrome c oxidase accessory protein FixG
MKNEIKVIAASCQTSDGCHANQQVIHAKQVSGFFRTLKSVTQTAMWLPFFVLPYLRWNGKQAVLLDIDHSQFHFFNLSIFPDDIWILSFALLIAAMVLFAATAIASRVWCGYFCFQTTWTDWFVWIEAKIEGNPTARRKLDAAPWNWDKSIRKLTKHALWLGVALLTAISFSIWFMDAFEYWHRLLHLQLPKAGWITLAVIVSGTYLYAGLMREQVCVWMCPYARFQSVMVDTQTIMPTYDHQRGEPRGKLRKDEAQQGACIDCFQCVQVCPTGIDIRQGSQLGCITCGLCIDACDGIMDKIGQPRGLIRYASSIEMTEKPVKKQYQQTRVWVYCSLILIAIASLMIGISHISPLTLSVTPERQPLFVQMSDGSIQNKYALKLTNKTRQAIHIKVSASAPVNGLVVVGAEQPTLIPSEHGTFLTVFVKVPSANITQATLPLRFKVEAIENANISTDALTLFHAPIHE